MQINFKQTDEQVRAEWAGKPSRVELVTAQADREWKRDTLIVLAVFVAFVILTLAVTV
jgi:hypothetical protein